MKKWILFYSLAIAGGAFLLEWLEYKYFVRVFSTEVYIALIALFFTGMGIWLGNRLTNKQEKPAFELNRPAIEALGLSERELEVLNHLAAGYSNKEIGEKLFVSVNTIKTHIKNLYAKLEVSSRTQAVQKARDLKMIP